MSEGYRTVTLAPGHTVRARRFVRAAAAPGKIIITNQRGRRWEIDRARWDSAPAA